ncbi:unnamed protein product [Bemisia tabaci]|uniref:Uncharacterized protein n=1 Tax=Bemisia tabaci TaxID=7038 RepID=A0A9P0AEY8_BEMTA|nr:unnamed protein product [Bemisia tabaci]
MLDRPEKWAIEDRKKKKKNEEEEEKKRSRRRTIRRREEKVKHFWMFPKALYGIVLAVGVYLIYPEALRIFSSEVVVGPLPEDVYWGAPKPESVKEDEIRPFKITTSPSARIFLGSIYPPLIEDPKEDHDRLYPLRDFFTWLWTETGYAHIHATKPDTIGAALLDSPTGLAAYILGKFATLTNPTNINLPDGGLTKKLSLDALLDNVMIYWTTDSILTSIRLHSEYCSTKYKDLNFEIAPVKAPTACARFRHELFYSPAFSLREKFKNLVKISKINDGGLYPTFELPDVVANDIWSSIPLFARANKNVTDSLKK